MSKRSGIKKRKKNQSSRPRAYTRAARSERQGGQGPITCKTQAALDRHLDAGKPVVIDFWAPWCGPCKTMGPIFERVAARFDGQATFLKINTEEAPQLGSLFNVRSIPTLLVMSGDQVIDSAVGLTTEARLSKMIQNAIDGQHGKSFAQRFRGLFGGGAVIRP